MSIYTRRGRCRNCMRQRDVYRIGRRGGGTYKRGGRSYPSSICAECANHLVRYLGDYAGARANRFDGQRLRDIVALDTFTKETSA